MPARRFEVTVPRRNIQFRWEVYGKQVANAWVNWGQENVWVFTPEYTKTFGEHP